MDHKAYLTLYCRFCGKRNVAGNTSRCLNKVDQFKRMVRILHDINISEESDHIYPKNSCDRCASLYKANGLADQVEKAFERLSENPDGVKKLARDLPISDFWAHSSIQCEICQDENYAGKTEAENRKLYEIVQRFTDELADSPALSSIHGISQGVEITAAPTSSSLGPNPAARPKGNVMGVKNEKQLAEKLEMMLRYLKVHSPRFRIAVLAEVFKFFIAQNATKVVAGLKNYGIDFEKLRGADFSEQKIIKSESQRLVSILQRYPTMDMVRILAKYIACDADSTTLPVYNASNINLDVDSAAFKAVKESKDPPGIVMMPKNETDGSGKGSLFIRKDGKRKAIDSSDSPAWKNPRMEGNKRFLRPGQKEPNVKLRSLSENDLAKKKTRFNSMLPQNRVQRADIVRFILANAKDSRVNLLKMVGINFDKNGGGYLCERGLSVASAREFENELSNLVDVQWATIMGEVIFRLADPRDWLSFEHIGINIDPRNSKVPAWIRIRHHTNLYIMNNFKRDNHGGTAELCRYIVNNLNLQMKPNHVRAVETIFQCSTEKAQEFVKFGKKSPPQSTILDDDVPLKGTRSRKQGGNVVSTASSVRQVPFKKRASAVAALHQEDIAFEEYVSPRRGRGRGRPPRTALPSHSGKRGRGRARSRGRGVRGRGVRGGRRPGRVKRDEEEEEEEEDEEIIEDDEGVEELPLAASKRPRRATKTAVKYESFFDDEEEDASGAGPSTSRGSRRISSAKKADDEDEDYDPTLALEHISTTQQPDIQAITSKKLKVKIERLNMDSDKFLNISKDNGDEVDEPDESTGLMGEVTEEEVTVPHLRISSSTTEQEKSEEDQKNSSPKADIENSDNAPPNDSRLDMSVEDGGTAMSSHSGSSLLPKAESSISSISEDIKTLEANNGHDDPTSQLSRIESQNITDEPTEKRDVQNFSTNLENIPVSNVSADLTSTEVKTEEALADTQKESFKTEENTLGMGTNTLGSDAIEGNQASEENPEKSAFENDQTDPTAPSSENDTQVSHTQTAETSENQRAEQPAEGSSHEVEADNIAKEHEEKVSENEQDSHQSKDLSGIALSKESNDPEVESHVESNIPPDSSNGLQLIREAAEDVISDTTQTGNSKEEDDIHAKLPDVNAEAPEERSNGFTDTTSSETKQGSNLASNDSEKDTLRSVSNTSGIPSESMEEFS